MSHSRHSHIALRIFGEASSSVADSARTCVTAYWALFRLSICLCSVISSLIAIKPVKIPSGFFTEEMDTDSQYNSPFFFLLWNSPRHTPPEVMVFHKCEYSCGGVSPDFRKRGFFPTTSSRAYPVSAENFGLTYSIFPSISVIIIELGLCSIAWDNLRSWFSIFFRSEISCIIPTIRTALPALSNITSAFSWTKRTVASLRSMRNSTS